MSLARRCCMLLLGLVLAWPALADTRVTLSRDAVALGDAVTLSIETDQPIASPDLAPLRNDFEVGGIDSARQLSIENGGLRTSQTLRVQLRPRRAGMLRIPALAIGNQRTAPLLLEVTQGASPSAPARASTASTQAGGPVFIDTVFDDDTPYVQQAVGVTVRLHYAIDLYNGEFRQPEPASGGSLQPVGSDARSVQVVGGRQYQVLERHYLLVPERSGLLRLPRASFNGEASGDFIDGLFGDARESVSAQAPARTLKVRPIPANAAQPWLPARSVTMRVPSPPRQARAGEAFDVVVELRADGATAAQLPELTLTGDGAQIFPEPAQPAENFASGRPQVLLTRRFSIVPQHAGTLRLQIAPVDWWDVAADALRRAQVPEMTVRVAPGLGRYAAPAPPSTQADSTKSSATDAPSRWSFGNRMMWPAFAALTLLMAAALVWMLRRRAHGGRDDEATSPAPADTHTARDAPASSSPIHKPDQGRIAAEAARHAKDFRRAIETGDLAAVARTLPQLATPAVATLAEARARLADPAQAEATSQLERALWGDGDAEAVRRQLKRAFTRGPSWRTPGKAPKPLLPPLYPER
ncbi:BatD family protein [Solilutibacter oculi]|nr:BatD family protein [Lysobacter oculi]